MDIKVGDLVVVNATFPALHTDSTFYRVGSIGICCAVPCSSAGTIKKYQVDFSIDKNPFKYHHPYGGKWWAAEEHLTALHSRDSFVVKLQDELIKAKQEWQHLSYSNRDLQESLKNSEDTVRYIQGTLNGSHTALSYVREKLEKAEKTSQDLRLQLAGKDVALQLAHKQLADVEKSSSGKLPPLEQAEDKLFKFKDTSGDTYKVMVRAYHSHSRYGEVISEEVYVEAVDGNDISGLIQYTPEYLTVWTEQDDKILELENKLWKVEREFGIAKDNLQKSKDSHRLTKLALEGEYKKVLQLSEDLRKATPKLPPIHTLQGCVLKYKHGNGDYKVVVRSVACGVGKDGTETYSGMITVGYPNYPGLIETLVAYNDNTFSVWTPEDEKIWKLSQELDKVKAELNRRKDIHQKTIDLLKG